MEIGDKALTEIKTIIDFIESILAPTLLSETIIYLIKFVITIFICYWSFMPIYHNFGTINSNPIAINDTAPNRKPCNLFSINEQMISIQKQVIL